MPEEQKGCRNKLRETANLLYTDNRVLNEAHVRKKNIAVEWLDHRNAYASKSWLLECVRMLKDNEKMNNSLKKVMRM